MSSKPTFRQRCAATVRVTLAGALAVTGVFVAGPASAEPGQDAAASSGQHLESHPIAAPSAAGLVLAVAVVGTETGTQPFDAVPGAGGDTSAADDVLRSNDTVEYAIEIQLTGSAADGTVTVQQTLPTGLVWPARAELPGYCGAGSTVSGDNTVLECVIHGLSDNSVNTVHLTATLTSTQPDGSVLAPPADAIVVSAEDSESGTTASATTSPDSVVVSSGPRLNAGITRSSVTPNVSALDGTVGWLVSHDLFLSLAGFNSDGGRGARGQSNIDGDVTFEIDLGAFSPGARLTEVSASGAPSDACAAGASNAGKYPAVSGGGPRAVTDSGRWTCRPVPGDPQRVQVTVSGADLGAEHVPTQSANGTSITSAGYLALGRLGIFVPLTDVPANGSIHGAVVLASLSAHGVDASGGILPNPPEPLDDNSADTTLVRRTSPGQHSSAYVDQASTSGLVPGQSTAGSADGAVVAGQRFEQRVLWTNDSSEGVLGDAIVCAVTDPKTQRTSARPSGAAPTIAAATGTGLPTRDLVIEYGTRPTVDAGADDDTRRAQLDATTCDDTDDTWTTDWRTAVATGVTKVRVRPIAGGLPAGAGIGMWVNVVALDDIATGEWITETYSIKSDANGPDRQTPTEYVEDGWWHGVYRPKTPPTDFPRGDALRGAAATVSVAKRSIDPAVEAGSPAQITAGDRVRFELSPQVTTPDGSRALAQDVVVTDSLPRGMAFDAADASPAPDSVVRQDDGSTLLEWRFEHLERGAEPIITYWAVSDMLTLGDLVNRVRIESPDDPTSLADFPADQATRNVHYAWQSVTLSAPSGLRVAKTVEQQAVEPGDPIDYSVVFANMSADVNQDDVRVIDVLPFAGDERGSTATAVLATAPEDVITGVIMLTNAPAAAVAEQLPTDGSPGFGTLPDGYSWCQQGEFGTAGCPATLADVTAIEFSTAVLSPGERIEMSYSLRADGAPSGAVFANDAITNSATQTLGARSAVVSTVVVTSSIGQRIWWDEDGDGLDGGIAAPGSDDDANDAGEPGVDGATLTLSGVDKFGVAVDERIVTDADGRYSFDGLVSGTYRVEVEGPPGLDVDVTAFRVGDDDDANSAIDPESIAMEDIVIADPAPTMRNGVDLTWNGGIVLRGGITLPGDAAGGSAGEAPADGDLASTGPSWLSASVAASLTLLLLGGVLLVVRRRRISIGG